MTLLSSAQLPQRSRERGWSVLLSVFSPLCFLSHANCTCGNLASTSIMTPTSSGSSSRHSDNSGGKDLRHDTHLLRLQLSTRRWQWRKRGSHRRNPTTESVQLRPKNRETEESSAWDPPHEDGGWEENRGQRRRSGAPDL
jgi:hypothetical protein